MSLMPDKTRVPPGFGLSLRRTDVEAVVAWWADLFASRPLAASGLLCLGVSIFCMLLVDAPLARILHSAVPVYLRDFCNWITTLGIGTGWFALSGLLLASGRVAQIYFRRRSALAARQCQGIASWGGFLLAALSAGAVVPLFKVLVGRLRPSWLLEKGIYGFEPFAHSLGQYGYPSGHSQTAFTVALCLAFAFPWAARSLFFLALVVAASRVVLGVHFFGDVVMGSWVGVALAAGMRPFFCFRPVRSLVEVRDGVGKLAAFALNPGPELRGSEGPFLK
jgi:membrane-associated phospholipid phosphatase